MRVSYKWLQQLVNVPWGPEELAQQLTMGGIEVEQISERSAGLSGVVAGRIERLEPHPNADKLQVCQMEVGQPELITIVTGASNVFVGAVVPTALVGAKLPIGMEINHADFRGIASAGMLCSADELGIDKKLVPPEMRDGIYILPSSVTPGSDVREVMGLNDYVLELELTPNRSDCLSMLGVAYEVAALAQETVQSPALLPLSTATTHPKVGVEVTAPDLCPSYLGLVVNRVAIAPSPLWLQNALQAAGLRPINNLVDITNYVLLELGQPLHAFDLDKLAGKKFYVRRATANEEIVTLDDVQRRLVDDDLVIADEVAAVAIAGIMGSQAAEVDANTQRVFLESALFDYKSIRRSSRRLGLRTDASSRFDKGVDPARVLMALQRAAQLLQELGCGEPEIIAVGQFADIPTQQVISLRPGRVMQLLGIDINLDEMRMLLERLGLQVDAGQEPWQVIAPSRRSDLQQEVDLIEEIARLYGLANIPVGKLSGPLMRGRLTALQMAEQDLRRQIIGLGLTEVLTMSFINPREVEQVVGSDHPWNQGLVLQNPLSSERSLMRPSLLFGLLHVLEYNAARQQQDLAIFEIANVFKVRPGAQLQQPEEPLHLGLACMGKPSYGWQGDTGDYDFFYLKGVMDTILASHGMLNVEWRRSEQTFLHPGRSAAIYWNGSYLGYLGELHPDVGEQFGLKQRAIVAEICLSRVLEQANNVPLFQGIPRYPAVVRDLAIVVERDVTVTQIAEVIKRAAGDLLVDLQLFDVYQGEQVADQRKSLAYSLVFQSRDKTLFDAEVSGLLEKIIGQLQTQVGARLR